MRATSSVDLPVGQDAAAVWLVDLARYPQWMPMVHSVVPEKSGDAWSVELRAKVGPFARSKKLRMVRAADTTESGSRHIRFERRETSASQHSPWTMDVRITPSSSGCTVTIDLEYGGTLWTAGMLDKVLAANIEEGRKGLLRAVSAPTH